MKYLLIHARNLVRSFSQAVTARDDASKGSQLFSSGEAFEFAYGRPPTPADLALVLERGVPPSGAPQPHVRRVIAVMDRQTHQSPVLVRFGPDDLHYQTMPNGFSIATDRADLSVGVQVGNPAGYEPHMTAFMEQHVRPGMRVLDVGANIGYHTLVLSKLVGETGDVIAFEPNSENCRLMMLSIARNGIRNIRLFPLAVSDTAGIAYFSPSIGSNGGLLPQREDVLSDPQCIVIPTAQIDSIVTDPVDFIKIDVEGAEGLAFAGAHKLLERSRPIIASEFSPEMIQRVSGVAPIEHIRRFTSLGYRLEVMHRDGGFTPYATPEALMGVFEGKLGHIEDVAFFPA